MLSAIVGNWTMLGAVAVKAVLLYLTVVIGLRFDKRRTLTQLSPFDLVITVAIGAIVGRVPNAAPTSWIQGAVTVASLVIVHRLIQYFQFHSWLLRQLTDRKPQVLVDHGHVHSQELQAANIRETELVRALRQRGVTDLDEIDYVILESTGQMSIVNHVVDQRPRRLVEQVIPSERDSEPGPGDQT